MIKMTVKSWFNPAPAVARLEAGADAGAKRVADFVAARARQFVPKATMQLHDSIEVRPSRAGRRWNVVAAAPYARHVEFGTTHHTPGGSYFIAPNPFLRQALAAGRVEFPRMLRDAMLSKKGDRNLAVTFDA